MRTLTANLTTEIARQGINVPFIRVVAEKTRIRPGTWNTNKPATYSDEFISAVAYCSSNSKMYSVFVSGNTLYLAESGSTSSWSLATDSETDCKPGIYITGTTAYVFYRVNASVNITRKTVNLSTHGVTATLSKSIGVSTTLGMALFALTDNIVIYIRADNNGNALSNMFVNFTAGTLIGSDFGAFVFENTVLSAANVGDFIKRTACAYKSSSSTGYLYVSNPDNGSVLGVMFIHDADSGSYGDTFLAIQSDLSEFQVINAFYDTTEARYYLTGRIVRTDEFAGAPTRIMLMPGNGETFAFLQEGNYWSSNRTMHVVRSGNNFYFSWRNELASCPVPSSTGTTITKDDILTFSAGESDRSGQASLVLRNGFEQYHNNTYIQRFNRIKVYLGYGSEEVLYGTYIITSVNRNFADAVRDLQVDLMQESLFRLQTFLHPYYLELTGRTLMHGMPPQNGDLWSAPKSGIIAYSCAIDHWNAEGWDGADAGQSFTPIVFNTGGPTPIDTTGSHNLGIQTDIIADQLILNGDLTPLGTASYIDVKTYGWSRVKNAGETGQYQDAVTPWLLVDTDGVEKCIAYSSVQSANSFLPQTWPTTQTGSNPIIHRFNIDGTNFKTTSKIKRIFAKVSANQACVSHISRYELTNVLAVYNDPRLPGQWVYDDTNPYYGRYQLTHVGKTCIKFFQKPINPRQWEVEAAFKWEGTNANETAAWGIVGFAVDSLNFIVGRYIRNSQNRFELWIVKNGQSTMLANSAAYTWNTADYIYMKMSYADGLFKIYARNPSTSGDWYLQLSHRFDPSVSGPLSSDPDAVNHLGIYGRISPPGHRVAAYKQPNNSDGGDYLIGLLPPIDTTGYNGFSASGNIKIGESRFSYTGKIAAHDIMGPYQCRRTQTEVTDPATHTTRNGIDITWFDYSQPNYDGKALCLDIGRNHLIDDSTWRITENGVNIYNRSRHFADTIQGNQVGFPNRAYVTPAFTGVGTLTDYQDIGHGEWAFQETDFKIILNSYKVSGGEDDATLHTLMRQAMMLSGATLQTNDYYRSTLALTATPTFLRNINEPTPDGFELQFTFIPANWATANKLRIYTNTTVKWWQETTEHTAEYFYFDKMVDGSLRVGLIDGVLDQYIVGADGTENVIVRLLMHDKYLSCYMNGIHIHTFLLSSVSYDTTGTSVSMRTDSGSRTLTDVYLRELHAWREAIPIDLMSSSDAVLSTIIQERPIKLYPRSDGSILATYTIAQFGFNAATPLALGSHLIRNHLKREVDSSAAASDYILYYSDVTVEDNYKYAQLYGFRSQMLQLPNLDEHEARFVTKIILMEAFEGMNIHSLIIRPHLAIEAGDLISISYTLSGTGTAITATLRVISTSISMADAEFVQSLECVEVDTWNWSLVDG